MGDLQILDAEFDVGGGVWVPSAALLTLDRGPTAPQRTPRYPKGRHGTAKEPMVLQGASADREVPYGT